MAKGHRRGKGSVGRRWVDAGREITADFKKPPRRLAKQAKQRHAARYADLLDRSFQRIVERERQIAAVLGKVVASNRRERLGHWAEAIRMADAIYKGEHRYRVIGTEKRRHYLQEMELLAMRLWRHINDMPLDVRMNLSVVRDGGKGTDELIYACDCLLQALSATAREAGDVATEFTTTPDGPVKVHAGEVAAVAAQAYLELTGLPPTRSVELFSSRETSPFVKMLAELYDVLAIKASAASQAKALLQEMRKT